MDVLFAPVYFVFAHQFLGTGLLAVLAFFAVRFLTNRPSFLRNTVRNYGFLLLLAALMLKLFFGHRFAVYLVHALGRDARGVVLDSYVTGTVYNNQRVRGHHVLLALADGRTVQETFRTDTFNVYPPHNPTAYPGEGQHFDARYLPHFPSAFIILTDDNGQDGFAHNLHCDRLESALRASEREHQFAPGNPQFNAETIRALQQYLDAHCELTPEARQSDETELDTLTKGTPAPATP